MHATAVHHSQLCAPPCHNADRGMHGVCLFSVLLCSGDSRAVISQSGRAIELSRDHKPHVPTERERIEASGGYVCTEGLLNGELAVARAIGDFHIPELKQLDTGGCACTTTPCSPRHATSSPFMYTPSPTM